MRNNFILELKDDTDIDIVRWRSTNKVRIKCLSLGWTSTAASTPAAILAKIPQINMTAGP